MAMKERHYVEGEQKYKITGYIIKDGKKYVVGEYEDEEDEFVTYVKFFGSEERKLAYKLKDEDFNNYQIIIPLYEQEYNRLYYLDDESLLKQLFQIFENSPSYYP